MGGYHRILAVVCHVGGIICVAFAALNENLGWGSNSVVPLAFSIPLFAVGTFMWGYEEKE